jgi:hypothetical protein
LQIYYAWFLPSADIGKKEGRKEGGKEGGKEGREEGREAGREGRKEREEEGRKEGRRKGRREGGKEGHPWFLLSGGLLGLTDPGNRGPTLLPQSPTS